ncbi:MAG: HNH endonuclease [Pseudomonadota bacterium]|nr:HNH endonuclease [Pseudomonadota bacterium]
MSYKVIKNGPYLLMKAPENYPGLKYRGKYIYEHQYVWWVNTKFICPTGYVIHHKNKDRHDNRFENLEIISQKSHTKLHSLEKSVKQTFLICEWCKKIFSRETRNYRQQIKNGQKYFHCCRSCQVRTQQKHRRESVAL